MSQLGEFLNDTVIDMYLLKIKAGMTEAQRGRCHFFNTFFYKKLTEKDNAPRQTAAERDAAKKAADAGGPAAKTDADLAFDRAYHRVKRWTKSIDLLAKDFIVVPIHKDLHWSLAIICHPGRTQPQAAAAAAAAVQQAKMVETVDLTVETQSPPVTAQAQEQQQEQQQPCPIILHLDSMAQGHKTVEVGKMLRAYLHREWQSRQARAEAVKAQAAPPPGVEGDLPALGMDVTDPASAAAFGVGDAAAGMVEPSFPEPAPPPLDFDAMECLRLQLPQQDNTTDCGCFLLAYVQYFAQALPVLVPGITGDMVQALKREKPRGEGVQLVIAGEESPCFLGKLWFHQGYGCHMRTLLRIEALQVLVDQGPKPQPGATAPAAAARDAGVAAGPDGAAGLGQDTDVAMVATPVVDKRVAHAAAELKRERDRAEMVEGRLEKEHREAIAKWRKKAQGGEAAEEVVAVEAGGGKGGRGKGKAAAAPAKGKTELAEVTLASDVEEEQSDVEDDMPVGLISRGKAGASGKKAMAGAPVQAARARSGRAAAAAASRPGDNKGDSIIIEGDDEAGPRRCGRLRDKPPGMMAISPYVSDADVEEDQPPAKTGLKRLRKRSGDQARGAEEVDLTLDYDDEGGGEQPERKAAGQGKRKKYTSDDDDGSPRADASAFEMKPAAPAPEGGEEPQRQAHTPPVDVGGAPVCEDDAPPGFTAPAPPQVDHLDLTGDDDPPVDMGDRLDLVPSGRQHAAAARAGTNNKKKPNVGGVAAKR